MTLTHNAQLSGQFERSEKCPLSWALYNLLLITSI